MRLCGESCKRSIVQEFAGDDVSSTSATFSPTAALQRPPTVSATKGLATYLEGRGSRMTASTTSTTSLAVSLPEPFDFELSTERYRAFGPDLANLWHEGGIHRVFEGQEVRIEPGEGGARFEPGDPARVEPVRRYLGAAFDLDAFGAFAATEPVLAPLVDGLRGFRPPLAPDPFETLVTAITAQQISLHAAFAVRNRFIQASDDRSSAYSASRASMARRSPRSSSRSASPAQGRIRRRARALGLDLEGLAVLPDNEEGAADRASRHRGVDCGLVPCSPPRPSRGLAGRRSRPAQGRPPLLRRGGHAGGRRALRRAREPRRPLSPHGP